MNSVTGTAWIFGDDVNTDVIHPPDFYSLDPDVVRRGLFHGLDPGLAGRISPGDILVAGRNFGCGSSRETSVRSLKLNRIGAIVAVDVARIFFRNATNNALPCVTFANPTDYGRIRPGARITVSFEDWTLRMGEDTVIALEPAGPFIVSVWEAGGLIELLGTGGPP